MGYYAFCQDEAVRVKVEGMPIHRFFAPEGFLMYGLEPKIGNFKGYTQIIDMPIQRFLDLAEPIPADDEKRHAPQEKFKQDVLNGTPTKWDIPYLVIKKNEDDIWKVVGHDGRHRAMLLKDIGFKEMPVRIEIPDVELNEELLPETLWCQNDKAVERTNDFFAFPITEDNFMKPYIAIGDGVMIMGEGDKAVRVALDESIYPSGCDSKKLKDYMGGVHETDKEALGKAPESCTTAKKNFEKNFVPNVAYRPDNTMPASNLKEYLLYRG